MKRCGQTVSGCWKLPGGMGFKADKQKSSP